MAPLRRYLQLTPHTVIEVRIYLDNPSDLHRWLLNPSPRTHPVILPMLIQTVRPLVLPKLREESDARNGKAKGKGGKGKKKGIKDVIVTAEFEVSIFLTEGGTSHQILRKRKFFNEGKRERLGKVGGKMTGESKHGPVLVEDDDGEATQSAEVRREEDDEEEKIRLTDVPMEEADVDEIGNRRRERGQGNDLSRDEGTAHADTTQARHFLSSSSSSGSETPPRPATSRETLSVPEAEVDSKKKLALNTSYEGFSIYGRILCLVVKRKGGPAPRSSGGAGAKAGHGGPGRGQTMVEDWITSTQVQVGGLEDGADD
ncbi:hypothetical protein MMC09_002252 [Bachmanniomyces sp. S44760]|nr:hypothetical protein [Bachmanniomyces sp. S44760]